VQVAGHFGERIGQLVADRCDCADDDNGDQRGDQAVFDGRRARLVADELLQGLKHLQLQRWIEASKPELKLWSLYSGMVNPDRET
jgi:hypothetical protein